MQRAEPLLHVSVEINPIAAILLFLSGFAALAHQLLWTRRMIDLLGSSAESSTRVFGCFFLGLASGAAIAAIYSSRIRNPWRVAGLAELALALLTIPILLLPTWTDWIWPSIGPELLTNGTGAAIKSAIAFVVVYPPAVMMGLVFPLVIQAVSTSKLDAHPSRTIQLYAINTLGGAVGLLAVVVVGLKWFGVFESMVVATILDGLLGIAMLMMNRRSQPPVEFADLPTEASVYGSWGPLSLAFFSGAIVLGLEVLAVQMLMLVATLSIYGPAAILFALLSCLAASAMIAPYLIGPKASSDRAPRAIRRMLVLSAIGVTFAPLVFYGIASYSNWFASNDSVFGFMFKLIAMTAITFGPVWMASGTLFPMAMVWYGCEAPTRESGSRLGCLLAVNGIGGLLGAEVTLRCLLPSFGIYGSLVLFALLMILAAWWSIAFSPQPTRIYRHITAATLMLFVLGVGLSSVTRLPTTNIRPGMTLIQSSVGHEGVVAVVGDDRGNRSIIMSNQYSLGGTSVRFDQERQVLLPLLLHPAPRHVGCIGLATGITAGAAITVQEIETVTAIELSPLVVEAADRDFSEFNHGIAKSPKASIVKEDGRTYIASTSDRFDVVAGDLFLPWAPGESRLYSIEHFKAVRRSLKKGGIFCQWLAMNQLTRQQMESIAKTFQQVFPDTVLFMNHFRGDSAMLALVGWNLPEGADVPWKVVEERCRKLKESNSIVDPILRSVDGVVMLYLGRWESATSSAPIITLDDPSLEISAATERLVGRPTSKYFIRASWIEFCRERRRALLLNPDPFVSANANLVELAGGLQEFDHALVARDKIVGAIAAQTQKLMPKIISEDATADWARWPASSSAWRNR